MTAMTAMTAIGTSPAPRDRLRLAAWHGCVLHRGISRDPPGIGRWNRAGSSFPTPAIVPVSQPAGPGRLPGTTSESPSTSTST